LPHVPLVRPIGGDTRIPARQVDDVSSFGGESTGKVLDVVSGHDLTCGRDEGDSFAATADVDEGAVARDDTCPIATVGKLTHDQDPSDGAVSSDAGEPRRILSDRDETLARAIRAEVGGPVPPADSRVDRRA